MGEMAVGAPHGPITVEDLSRMAEAGIFREDERIELINGDVIVVPYMGARHVAAVNRLNRLFSARYGQYAIVQVQLPVIVNAISEPVPDVALLRLDEELLDGRKAQAIDVVLLVEAADSSRDFDKTVKRRLYAEIAILEYWVVDHIDDLVERYLEPRDGDYDVAHRVRRGETLLPLAFPTIGVTVDELLGPSGDRK